MITRRQTHSYKHTYGFFTLAPQHHGRAREPECHSPSGYDADSTHETHLGGTRFEKSVNIRLFPGLHQERSVWWVPSGENVSQLLEDWIITEVHFAAKQGRVRLCKHQLRSRRLDRRILTTSFVLRLTRGLMLPRYCFNCFISRPHGA